jgi:hypothetical protein
MRNVITNDAHENTRTAIDPRCCHDAATRSQLAKRDAICLYTRRLQPPLHDLSPPMAGRSGFQPSAEATTFQVVEYSHLFIIRT